jgi:annexin A7/11
LVWTDVCSNSLLVNVLFVVAQSALDPQAYFAERLYWSMKGAGTKDSQLIRVIVSRSEVEQLP